MSPDITGIRGNEERQIANQRHTFRMGMLLELIGLAEQQELREPNLIDFGRQLLARMRQTRRDASDQLYGPLEIIEQRKAIRDFCRGQ